MAPGSGDCRFGTSGRRRLWALDAEAGCASRCPAIPGAVAHGHVASPPRRRSCNQCPAACRSRIASAWPCCRGGCTCRCWTVRHRRLPGFGRGRLALFYAHLACVGDRHDCLQQACPATGLCGRGAARRSQVVRYLRASAAEKADKLFNREPHVGNEPMEGTRSDLFTWMGFADSLHWSRTCIPPVCHAATVMRGGAVGLNRHVRSESPAIA